MTQPNSRHDVKVTTLRPCAVALAAALSLLALAGCAAEPAPAGTPDAVAVESETPAPRAVRAGVTGEPGTELYAGNDRLAEAQKSESEKLGGISVAAVQCALSFSTITNTFEPTWVISEPGPVGQYGSRDEAIARADGWSQPGKKMYVVINNLGC